MKILLTENGETTIIPFRPEKPVIRIRNRGEKRNIGVCKVSYGHGYYNEFEYNGYDDLIYKLKPCLERELISEYGGRKK